MKTGRISALALAIALGMITSAEAEDWTGGYTTFGLSRSNTELNEIAGERARENGGVDVAPYVAFGYDWAVGNVTLGVVADIDLTGTDNSDLLSAGKGSYAESDWFATLRGRVGVAAGEKLHLYASGGLATMQVGATDVGLFGGGREVAGGSVRGRVAGFGLEYNLSAGRNLSIEYLHGSFDRSGNLSENPFTSSTVAPELDSLRVGYTMRF